MTPSPDTLQSNRELDAAIAEQVFGWVGALKCNPEMGLMPDYRTMDEIPHYSSDPAAMMQVVEKMRERGSVTVSWGDSFVHCVWYDRNLNALGSVYEPTAPLAVCRCALAAVAQEVK